MNKNGTSEDLVGVNEIKVFLRFVLKNSIWIIVGAIVCGIAANMLVKRFVPKKYVSTVKFYASVNYSVTDISGINTQYTYTKSAVESYTEILKSNDYYDKVVGLCGNDDITRNFLLSSVSVTTLNDTNIMYITVTSPSPEISYNIAKTISDTAGDAITATDEYAIIRVIETPEEAKAPTGSAYLSYTAIGAVFGALIVVAAAIIKDAMNTKILSQERLKQRYPNIPVLAEIPEFGK